MSEPQKASLKDMLNYTPQEYFSSDERALIRSVFKNNPDLFKVLRKIMLPSVADPDLPIEEFAKDAYLAGKSWAQLQEKERASLIVARQEAIEFVLGGLMYLQTLANMKELSEAEEIERRKKDSAK